MRNTDSEPISILFSWYWRGVGVWREGRDRVGDDDVCQGRMAVWDTVSDGDGGTRDRVCNKCWRLDSSWGITTPLQPFILWIVMSNREEQKMEDNIG
ncbi:hypothetical protein SUGI_0976710 [Cryptomeria japonica]|nr:hypothetical protein SUGI_0976710 [Cryptomeria japonica]